MKISQAKGFFNAKVPIGSFFNVPDSDVWVEMREPCEDETFRFSDDKAANAAFLKKLWKDCLVGHNFENEDGTPATKDEVIQLIQSRGWLVAHIVEKWNESIRLQPRSSSD